jgi:hypothetical protein
MGGEGLSDFGAPKKKAIAKKPELGKKPALSSIAPKAAPVALKPAAKATNAPLVKEEDLGPVLTLEEAVEKCEAFYDS